MKKFLIFVFVFSYFSMFRLNAYTVTGHDAITSLTFFDEEENKLLVDMTSSEIEAGYKKLGNNKFFGWKDYFFIVKQEAVYIGEVIFARTNKTNQVIEIDYKVKEVQTESRSIKTTGSLNATFGAKLKKMDVNVKGNGEIVVTKTKSYTFQEDVAFKLVIQPHYKVVFQVTGDALVTNGVSKYSAFGITFKKGSWECIDIVTKYYELYEEKLPK